MYNEIVEVLRKDYGVTEKNKKWTMNGAKIERHQLTKIAGLVGNTFGITADDVFALVEDGSQKTAIDIPLVGAQSRQNVITTNAFDAIKFNRVDEKLFERFFISLNPLDQSTLLFVRASADEYKPISLSQSPWQQLAAIHAACQAVDVDGISLADWLEQSTHKMMDALNAEVKKIFDNKAIPLTDKNDAICKYCLSMMPASALHSAYKLHLLADPVSIDGDTLYTPRGVRLLDKGGRPFNVFQHILDYHPHLTLIQKKLIDLPVPYATRPGIPCITYKNLFDYMHAGETPTWDFYLTRYTTDEADVLKAFIYSIFDAENKGRQLLYIYDTGFSGKSAMINAISAGLGDGLVAALQKDSLSNQFGLAKVWDKRLCTIDDNKNPNIIRSEKMHMMLGNGRGEIEQKGRNSFSAQFNLKVIAAGNILPEIDTFATHEISRLILLKPKVTDSILQQIAAKNADGSIKMDSYGRPVLIGDANFSNRLAEELPAFLSKCKTIYDQLCPNNANIILPDSCRDALYDLDDAETSSYDAAVYDLFMLEPGLSMPSQELADAYYGFAPKYHLDASSRGYSEFCTYLQKRGCKASRGPRPARLKIISGIAPKIIAPRGDSAFTTDGW